MNKKVLSIILGIVVLFIWVKVFSKIFDNFSDDQLMSGEATTYETLDLSTFIHKDSLPNLELNYRDPFLGDVTFDERKTIKTQSNSHSNHNKKRVVEKPIIVNERWPAIHYHGFVRIVGSTSGTVLLKIGNTMHKTKEGEVINNEFIIKKAYRDSIILSRNEITKTFYK